MITEASFKNFGPLDQVDWKGLGQINLVIGENDCGKTFLLKGMYCAVRALEEYRKGNDKRSMKEVLREKLYWTFQPEKIGDLVSRGRHSASCQIKPGERKEDDFRFAFTSNAEQNISLREYNDKNRDSSSLFLPAKEVLSLHSVILQSRELDKQFGFDDTYFDLAVALRKSPTMGRNPEAFSKARTKLEALCHGKAKFDKRANAWTFQRKQGGYSFPMGVTAEGIKKIAILDTLLGNRYLKQSSMVFMDEPESALHPAAISAFMDIIVALAKSGPQFFLASHSYFVIKKLYLLAQHHKMSIPLLSFQEGRWVRSDLLEGLPENPIIRESIRLYEEEIKEAMA